MFICRECVRKTLLIPTRQQRLYTPHFSRNGPPRVGVYTSRATVYTKPPERNYLRSTTTPKTRHEAAVAQAVNYHRDPYTVAQFVQNVLKQDRYDEALEVVRNSTSRKMDVVVSWNHLLHYLMAKNRPKVALKIFTDMKKRGQVPNSQTYTAIFGGCSRLLNPRPFLPEALRIYSLMRDSKRLPPNIIHINSLVNACGRAHDLESLYSVLGDVTETGALAPDARTYTITFNSLRSIYRRPSTGISGGMDTLSMERERASTIFHANKIWGDARRRWLAGKLTLDEAAVCAYGRLILEEPSWETSNEIFDLLQEIMSIPKPDDASLGQPKTLSIAGTTNYGAGYVRPNSNALSMLLGACEHPQLTGKASPYWTTLTNAPYYIKPDAENYHQYLRTLRRAHNSAKALEVLLEVPPQFVAPKTFRLGLSTCAKDNINPRSFEHAGKMMNAMEHTLPTPDPQALRIYLRVATLSGMRAFKENGEPGAAEYAKQLTRSLERVWDPMRMAWDHAFGGPPMWNIPNLADNEVRESMREIRNAEVKKKLTERQLGYRMLDLKAMAKEDQLFDEEEEAWLEDSKETVMTAEQQREASALANHLVQYNDQREAVAVARRMLAMFDRVLDMGGGGMADSDIQLFKKRRNQLNGRVIQFFEDRELREPNLPTAIRRAQVEKERMRIEEARMRYQKPKLHRYTTL